MLMLCDRYQLVGGLDRLLFDRTTYLWTYVMLSGATRLASNQVGELSRAWWQGLPAPNTLTYHTTPQARRVKRKVSKRVPKPKPQVQSLGLQQEQDGNERNVLGLQASAALPVLLEGTGSSVDSAGHVDGSLVPLQPAEGVNAMASAPMAMAGTMDGADPSASTGATPTADATQPNQHLSLPEQSPSRMYLQPSPHDSEEAAALGALPLPPHVQLEELRH